MESFLPIGVCPILPLLDEKVKPQDKDRSYSQQQKF